MKKKNFFRLIERISPRVTAKIAFHFISNPRAKKFRSFEKSIIEQSKKSSISFKKFDIAMYEWGKGEKTALLVHGWEGRASNFGAIIPVLVKKGYRVISFDAPSHGNSTKRKTDFFDIPELIEVLLKRETYNLVITHSIGSVLALMAMSSLKYKGNTLIQCTTPDKFIDYIQETIRYFGLTYKTKNAFIKLIRKTTNYEPLDMEASLFVKNISFDNAFFIHDKKDRVVKIENSKQVCNQMKNAAFIEIEKTGHFKMLWSDKLLAIIEEKV
ncbi:alpha/beta fold hydrolase [Tenacibaculum ovolyticum]|uniref:alpha/beta fold hydrolase n=1 Tax=Tenacibaculum ovolyticum TaxID=104270 RepID=UPI0004008AAF|nr:alpha/beta hydrolase [Tenacibaculum ovolyticum]